MFHSLRLCLVLYVLMILGSSLHADDNNAQHVRSLLSNSCFACHGPDQEQREGGFRLDDLQSMRRQADSGKFPVVPGDPSGSEILRRISVADEDERMPPPAFGKRLTKADIEAIRQWIADGAELPQHWAFLAPTRSSIPQWPVAELGKLPASWLEHPIDRFVLARQLELGLYPSEMATRSELLRRLSLDLVGLPPASEDVDAFEQDTSPEHYERQVERLLASPAFGEHWGRKWLDLARYADSAGYADDPARTIWAYRDWVIGAINSNMPVDQFTIEQLAGDLLPDTTSEQIVATAFHRNTMTNNEGGTNDEEFRTAAIVDRVNTTMAVWMGVTIACAQCHTHKYDPFTQEEYFKLYAILNQSQDADRKDESPLLPLFTAAQTRQQQQWEARSRELLEVLEHPTSDLLQAMPDWEASLQEPKWSALEPIGGSSTSKSDFNFSADHRIEVKPTGNNIVSDTYLLNLRQPASSATPVRAIGLRTLPSDKLPGGGAGLSGTGANGGNFVITKLSASVIRSSPQNRQLARYVRVELPGKARILSLAEVQVFAGEKNVAIAARATQSSTAHDGVAARAIDGETSGDFDRHSTTHTATEKNPWWEIDLHQPQTVDRIVVWNRTDNALSQRLDGVKVQLLDDARKLLFEKVIEKAPKTNTEFKIESRLPIEMKAAYADYSQNGFSANDVVDNDAASGWAVGGSVAISHLLTLIPSHPIELQASDVIELSIEHKSSHRHHLLGSFRLETTADAGVESWSMLPSELIATLAKPSTSRTESEQKQLEQFYGRHVAEQNAPGRAELDKLTRQLAELKPATSVPVMRQLDSQSQRETFIQIRGNYKSLGEKVTPGTPAVFHPLETHGTPDRLALARWLVDRQNPLTARVWVNRLWESVFGIGIVRTSEEFGAQGDKPTHPELLDWLACELMENQWDLKRILRLIVTSQAYRQTSRVSLAALEADRENVWLARGPRVRLTAEMVRDQALQAAGLLTNTMYGAPVRPPQPSMGLKAAFGSETDWQTSQGEDRYRRGIYTTWRRSNPYPSMATFDAPSREVCTLRRDSTNTPLQALVTLNDPGFVEAAQGLARLVVLHNGHERSDSQRLQFAFRRCTSRTAQPQELNALNELLLTARAHFANRTEEALKLATEPLGPLEDKGLAPELAAWTSVCNVLLNLDEVLMKR